MNFELFVTRVTSFVVWSFFTRNLKVIVYRFYFIVFTVNPVEIVATPYPTCKHAYRNAQKSVPCCRLLGSSALLYLLFTFSCSCRNNK